MKAAFGTGIGKMARVAVAFVGAVGIAASVAWSLPRVVAAGITTGDRKATTVTEAKRAGGPVASAAVLADDAAKSRGKPLCKECGIIEAVQRIDTPLAFTGWCDAAEIARTKNSGRAYGRDFRADREPLRDTVDAAIAASRTSTRDGVNTKHRIVVRLRNGSRQVFEEATPRMVNVGDRMVVIAGAPRTSG